GRSRPPGPGASLAQDRPHRLGAVPSGPERRLANDDPDLRLPVDAVNLVQPQISDVLALDLDGEDLLVRPPFIVPEPSRLLRQRHGRIAAEEPDDLRIREPFHAPPEVRRRQGPEEDPLAAQHPTGFQHSFRTRATSY